MIILTIAFVAASRTAFGLNPVRPRSNGNRCEVRARGNRQDDVPNILEAFKQCNGGGTVVFPEGENCWIAQRLNPILNDVTVEWKGVWTLSDNPTYWRDVNNSWPIFFQNHHAAFVITGNHIHIDGYNTGGINGNGNSWYNSEKTVTQPVRPMNFVFWNASEVMVENCKLLLISTLD